MKYKIILIAVLAILLVVFALQNTEVVITKLWFWEIKTPRALLILLSMLGGLIIGMVTSVERIKRKHKRKEETKVKEQD
jgi:uncharacterized integral membrane protein